MLSKHLLSHAWSPGLAEHRELCRRARGPMASPGPDSSGPGSHRLCVSTLANTDPHVSGWCQMWEGSLKSTLGLLETIQVQKTCV